MDSPRVGIVITTKNRREILRHTLTRTLEQDYPNLCVAVFDDGSTDGTAEMVRSDFPTVRVERSDGSRGYIAARNAAARIMTDCRHLISLDDDSWLLRKDGVARAVQMFERHPDAALLSFEIFGSYHLPLDPDPERDGAEIASFAGCGHAIDRERFLALGGFPECFEFYGEENDLVMRVMEAGFTCRFAAMIPVYHAETLVGRNEARIREFSLANTLTLICLREPAGLRGPHLLYVLGHRGLLWARSGKIGSLAAGVRRWHSRWPVIRRDRKVAHYRTIRRYRALQRQWRDFILARRRSTAPRQAVELPEELEDRA